MILFFFSVSAHYSIAWFVLALSPGRGEGPGDEARFVRITDQNSRVVYIRISKSPMAILQQHNT